MPNPSQAEVLKLKTAHMLYEKLGKYFWVLSSILFLAGGAGMGASMYADYMSLEVRTAAAYGAAMSGGTYDHSEPAHTPGGGASDSWGGFCLGVGGLVGAFWVRRLSKRFLALPSDVQQTVAMPTMSLSDLIAKSMTHQKTNGASQADELVKLHALYIAGALTEAEYAIAKAKVVNGAA